MGLNISSSIFTISAMLKLFLWLRYLRKKKIVFLSITAVALSVSLLIVVSSLFTGFIKAFQRAAVEAIGDVVLAPPTKFAKYDLFIERLEQTGVVESATAILSAHGLLHLGKGNVRAVEIWGIEPVRRAKVMGFDQYLLRQRESRSEPSFQTNAAEGGIGGFVGIGVVAEPDEETDKYDYDAVKKMFGQEVVLTTGTVSQADEEGGRAEFKRKVMKFTIADVVETGVYQFDKNCVYLPIEELQKTLYPDETLPVASQIQIKLADNKEDNSKYLIIQVWSVVFYLGIVLNVVGGIWFFFLAFRESILWGLGCIFVPFVALFFLFKHWKDAARPLLLCVLGAILFLSAVIFMMPDTADDAETDAALAVIRGVWRSFVGEQLGADLYLLTVTEIQTAKQMQKRYVDAYRKQMGILLLIFGVVSFGVVLLIFCVFYMIVRLKQKDIAIIKSCGAAGSSIAWIFVGFGVCVGIVGSGIGAALGYIVTKNVNTIEEWIGIIFGLKLWKSSVYMFSKIPNEVDWASALPIVLFAIMAAAIGTLIPAIVAAWTKPIEILRYE